MRGWLIEGSSVSGLKREMRRGLVTEGKDIKGQFLGSRYMINSTLKEKG